MKKLTEKQQAVIDEITGLFEAVNAQTKSETRPVNFMDFGELYEEANSLRAESKMIEAKNEGMRKFSLELLRSTIDKLNEDFKTAGVKLVAKPRFNSGIEIEVEGREVFGSGYGKNESIHIHLNMRQKSRGNDLPWEIVCYEWSDEYSNSSRTLDSKDIEPVLLHYKAKMLSMIKYTLDHPKIQH